MMYWHFMSIHVGEVTFILMVFLWFSYGFLMVFYGFPMVFLWFSYGFYGFPPKHLTTMTGQRTGGLGARAQEH